MYSNMLKTAFILKDWGVGERLKIKCFEYVNNY